MFLNMFFLQVTNVPKQSILFEIEGFGYHSLNVPIVVKVRTGNLRPQRRLYNIISYPIFFTQQFLELFHNPSCITGGSSHLCCYRKVSSIGSTEEMILPWIFAFFNACHAEEFHLIPVYYWLNGNPASN